MSFGKRALSLSPEHDSTRQHLEETFRTPSYQKLELLYPSTTSKPLRPIAAVPFQQPALLTTFSYTPAHELEFTDSALRYYIDPPPRADLKYGYDRWIRRPDERGRIDSLLRAVVRVKGKMDASGQDGKAWLDGIGVICWRGIMTKLLTAPYEERDGWDLNVMLINDTLYFEEHLTDAKLEQKNDMAPKHRIQTYYGYAFESFCTSDHPSRPSQLPRHPPGWGGDVDTNVQWCNIIKTKLADTRIVIGGEVDCARGQFRGKTDNLVELKTSLTIRNAQDEARFEQKLLKFYFQSFLLGVPEIVVGFRTPAGQLSTLQTFKTIEIPRLVRDKPHAWDPLICLDWGKRFLAFLKSNIAAQARDQADKDAGARYSTHSVWRVRFLPRVGITMFRLDHSGVEEVRAGDDRVGFLPSWYLPKQDGDDDPSLTPPSTSS